MILIRCLIILLLSLIRSIRIAQTPLVVFNNPDLLKSGKKLQVQPLPEQKITWLKHRTTFAKATYCIDKLLEWECVTCDPRFKVTDITFAGEFESTVFAYAGYVKSLKTIVILWTCMPPLIFLV